MATFWRELMVLIPEFKVAYFVIPKAAGTSIKLALAHLMSLDETHFGQSDWPHSTSALGVHNQHLAPWPKPGDIDAALDVMASEADEWFVFTVVRDPLRRLVSAWELLILLEDPHLKVMGRWTPEMTVSLDGVGSAIAENFQAFASSSQLKLLASQDPHFIPQSVLLADTPLVPEVFHLESMEALQQALAVHFASLGLQVPKIDSANESLLPRSLWDLDGLDATQVHDIYAEDYLRFGYSRNAFATKTGDTPEREELLYRAIVRVRDANRRILHLWLRSTR